MRRRADRCWRWWWRPACGRFSLTHTAPPVSLVGTICSSQAGLAQFGHSASKQPTQLLRRVGSSSRSAATASSLPTHAAAIGSLDGRC